MRQFVSSSQRVTWIAFKNVLALLTDKVDNITMPIMGANQDGAYLRREMRVDDRSRSIVVAMLDKYLQSFSLSIFPSQLS